MFRRIGSVAPAAVDWFPGSWTCKRGCRYMKVGIGVHSCHGIHDIPIDEELYGVGLDTSSLIENKSLHRQEDSRGTIAGPASEAPLEHSEWHEEARKQS